MGNMPDRTLSASLAVQAASVADVLKASATVWRYRERLSEVWPTPDVTDAFLFAVTELGEAVDAHLRANTVYARNNGRDRDMLEELADLAMMLLTAAGEGLEEPYLLGWRELEIAELVYCMGQAMVTFVSRRNTNIEQGRVSGNTVWPTLYLLSLWFCSDGTTMAEMVEERLRRIEAKVTGTGGSS